MKFRIRSGLCHIYNVQNTLVPAPNHHVNVGACVVLSPVHATRERNGLVEVPFFAEVPRLETVGTLNNEPLAVAGELETGM